MSSPSSPRALGTVSVRYEIPASRDDWTLPEEPVPESQPHDLTLDLLKALLVAWAAGSGRDLQVARNLAVRWDEGRPKVGVDPDVCVFERAPEGDEIESLCLWRPGHRAPLLAIEVVSGSSPRKDYEVAPDKYAASGTEELWVFDPKLAGPKGRGGPFRLQLWRRGEGGEFSRIYAGPGPVFSPAVGGWLFAVSEGQRLRFAEDESGTRFWRTAEEAEREAKEAERQAKEAERKAKENERRAREAEARARDEERRAKEAERQAKETALTRVAELEAELRRLRGG